MSRTKRSSGGGDQSVQAQVKALRAQVDHLTQVVGNLVDVITTLTAQVDQVDQHVNPDRPGQRPWVNEWLMKDPSAPEPVVLVGPTAAGRASVAGEYLNGIKFQQRPVGNRPPVHPDWLLPAGVCGQCGVMVRTHPQDRVLIDDTGFQTGPDGHEHQLPAPAPTWCSDCGVPVWEWAGEVRDAAGATRDVLGQPHRVSVVDPVAEVHSVLVEGVRVSRRWWAGGRDPLTDTLPELTSETNETPLYDETSRFLAALPGVGALARAS